MLVGMMYLRLVPGRMLLSSLFVSDKTLSSGQMGNSPYQQELESFQTKTPVSLMAQQTGNLEGAAKDNDKDSISII